MSHLSTIKNQRGLAMIETLPLIVIFVVLLSFSLGLFGVVHTAVLNSMAARTYAFETFRNRSDTTLFRDRKADGFLSHYSSIGNRVHTITSEQKTNDTALYATARRIGLSDRTPTSDQNAQANVQDHNFRIYDIQGRNRRGGVAASPAWIMVGYGLCIDAKCGDN